MTVNKWLTAKPSKEPDERLLRVGGGGGGGGGGGRGGEGEGGLPCGIAAYYTIDSHLWKIIETKAHNQVVM